MAQPDITTADLDARARQRVDMVGSTFVTDAEVALYREAAWREFYMRLVSKFEDFFLRTGQTISAVAGTTAYNLPTDFLKLRGVRHHDREFLRRLDLKELPNMPDSSVQRGRPTHYFTHGAFTSAQAQLVVTPAPDTSYTLDLYYTPIVSLGDVTSGALRIVAGWDEYIVLTMAMKMKDKEESDCSVLIAERTMLTDVIEKSMTPFDSSEPFAVIQQASMPRPSIYGDPMLWEDYLG